MERFAQSNHSAGTHGEKLMKIGFVGLGAMGQPMAENLLAAGNVLRVHNRTRNKEERLAEAGAVRAATPAEAADGCDFLITIVSDTPDVEEVLFGPNGAADSLSSDSIVIDMSTVDPGAAREFSGRLGERGIGMLDAPVSGGTEGARAATLSIMVGGSREHFERSLGVLSILGERITHIGPAGSGQMTKAINQVIIAGTFLAVAEGMVLGMRAGLDMEKAVAALSGGAAGSWVLSNRAGRMIEHTYPLGFKLSLHRKDLRIALRAATDAGVELPLSELVAALEDRLIGKGLGDQDMSVIARAVEEL